MLVWFELIAIFLFKKKKKTTKNNFILHFLRLVHFQILIPYRMSPISKIVSDGKDK